MADEFSEAYGRNLRRHCKGQSKAKAQSWEVPCWSKTRQVRVSRALLSHLATTLCLKVCASELLCSTVPCHKALQGEDWSRHRGSRADAMPGAAHSHLAHVGYYYSYYLTKQYGGVWSGTQRTLSLRCARPESRFSCMN